MREIDGETLVYDRSRDAASCLNEFAARVWRECDGETSVAAIAAALGEDERAVWLALHQLTKAQLLTEAIAFPPDMSAAKSRREVAGRLGLGAAAFVTSIVAPMPAQAASYLNAGLVARAFCRLVLPSAQMSPIYSDRKLAVRGFSGCRGAGKWA